MDPLATRQNCINKEHMDKKMTLHMMNLANHQYLSAAKDIIVSLTLLAHAYVQDETQILAVEETQAWYQVKLSEAVGKTFWFVHGTEREKKKSNS